MKIMPLQNYQQNFGARFDFNSCRLASESVNAGMSRKFVDKMMKKIGNFFPGDDYYIYFEKQLDKTKDKMVADVIVEKKTPERSVYKTAKYFLDGNKENPFFMFYKAVKKLATLDFLSKKGQPAETIWLT